MRRVGCSMELLRAGSSNAPGLSRDSPARSQFLAGVFRPCALHMRLSSCFVDLDARPVRICIGGTGEVQCEAG